MWNDAWGSAVLMAAAILQGLWGSGTETERQTERGREEEKFLTIKQNRCKQEISRQRFENSKWQGREREKDKERQTDGQTDIEKLIGKSCDLYNSGGNTMLVHWREQFTLPFRWVKARNVYLKMIHCFFLLLFPFVYKDLNSACVILNKFLHCFKEWLKHSIDLFKLEQLSAKWNNGLFPDKRFWFKRGKRVVLEPSAHWSRHTAGSGWLDSATSRFTLGWWWFLWYPGQSRWQSNDHCCFGVVIVVS